MQKITQEEREESIKLALQILKATLKETNTSLAIQDNLIFFFSTEDFMKVGSLAKIPSLCCDINDLVK